MGGGTQQVNKEPNMADDGPGGLDERYVHYREFAALEKDYAGLKSRLEHVPGELSRLIRAHESVESSIKELTRALDGKGGAGSEALTNAALAIHRAVEAMSKQPPAVVPLPAPPPPPAPPPILQTAIMWGGLILFGSVFGQPILTVAKLWGQMQ
jgi:hypothetical protein